MLCAVGVVGASAQVLVSITMMGVLVTVWLRGGRSPVRPAAPVLVLHAALHLPWMIPALFASDQQLIDPAVGFEAFAPRADLPLGIAAEAQHPAAVEQRAGVIGSRRYLEGAHAHAEIHGRHVARDLVVAHRPHARQPQLP